MSTKHAARRQQLQQAIATAPAGSGISAPGGCLKEAASRAAEEAVNTQVGDMRDRLARSEARLDEIRTLLAELSSRCDLHGDELAMARRRVNDHVQATDSLFEEHKRRAEAADNRMDELSADSAILTEIVIGSVPPAS